jgi:4-carboxymuconolactone decarboxylase
MKYIILNVFYTIFLLSGSFDKKSTANENSHSDTNKNSQMTIKIGSKTFEATLYDNATATAFKAMLPLTIHMVELNDNEKYADLKQSLPVNAVNPKTIQNGDLMMYGSNTLVLFYKNFSTSYSYTQLGLIENPSGLAAALGSKNVTVTFELTTKIKKMPEQNKTSIFPIGNPLPKEWFTGNAFLHVLVAKDENHAFSVGSVTFEQGARTVWHTHPKGQVLMVTEGEGFYQEKGKSAKLIKKGDVVNIPKNTEHWHGASAASKMVHIAITNYKDEVNVVWLKPVTDEEYNAVIEANQPLNAQQQSIVSIAALTATGDLENLKTQLNAGLDAGLTLNEIKEILVQMYAYCGFPRSLNGINTFMSVVEERKAKGITDVEGKNASPITDVNKYETGKRNLQTLTGQEEKGLKTGANAFAPTIDTFLKEHLFADIFSRDVLTFHQRELATISVLSSLDGVVPQLQFHLAVGLNIGLTESQLTQVFSIIDIHVGKQQAEIAKNVLLKVIDK